MPIPAYPPPAPVEPETFTSLIHAEGQVLSHPSQGTYITVLIFVKVWNMYLLFCVNTSNSFYEHLLNEHAYLWTKY